MHTDQLIQRMRQVRQDRLQGLDPMPAYRARLDRRQAEREVRRQRQLEIAERGFEMAREILTAVAQGFDWPPAPDGEKFDCLTVEYQMPVRQGEKAESFRASAAIDPWGDDFELGGRTWIPRVGFSFGPFGFIEFVSLTDEELSDAILEDEAGLRAKMKEALLEAYSDYVESGEFPVEVKAVVA